MLTIRRNEMTPNVSRFFDEDWTSLFDWSTGNGRNGKMNLPAVNIKESEDEFLVEVAAPGMKKEDFKVEINNGLLKISSEKENETSEEQNGYTRKEFYYNSFERSFNLNDQLIDEEKVHATYEEGILKLTLPKREEAKPKPSRLIEIA